jgi:arginine deiminase
MKIQVNSEIGTLKKVLVHRPGKEVERLYPEIFERLLFDDIMDLNVAQEEHDIFMKILEDNGVEVLYVERLVAKCLDEYPKTKEVFIKNFISEAIESEIIAKAAYNYFNSYKDNLKLVNAMIAGIKKSEMKVNAKGDFEAMVALDDPYPFYLDPIPNILFQRDPIASIFDGMNIHNMRKETRKREAIFYNYLFKYSKEFKGTKSVLKSNHQGNMEGGDVLVINKETLFIGISERTTAKACEE